MKKRTILSLLGVTFLILTASISYAKKNQSHKMGVEEHFMAFFGPHLPVIVTVKGFSTVADFHNLVKAYQHGGQKALAKAIKKKKKGSFSFGRSENMPLLFVESSTAGSVHRLTLIGEAPNWYSHTGSDVHPLAHRGYPYTLIQLEVDQSGKNQGLLYQFVKLSFDQQGRIHISSLSKRPAELQDVHLEK